MTLAVLPLTLLCLGDSYTIGEAVQPSEKFSFQAVEILKKEGIIFSEPEVIAQTGWTTDELASAIDEKNLQRTFDFVTLLIGVNNQYRQRDIENYKKEFAVLLKTAIKYADGKNERVVVISIPDWGATPFVAQDSHKRSREKIAKEIDTFNAAQESICIKEGIHFINITGESRNAKDDRSLIEEDGLHPSAKMYAEWAAKVAVRIEEVLNKQK
jgi:lysophospholipase L1-like esterase